jgi:hypothetical protein
MENKAKSNKHLAWFVVLLIFVLVVVWWNLRNSAIEYSADTEIEVFDVSVGETVIFKDGATITVKGNATIDGELKCDNGPLSLVVEGDLRVNGQLKCERDNDLPDDDIGNGMLLVARGEVEFSENAVVQTNGHLQLVDSNDKLALDQAAIDSMYNSIAEDTGGGLRIGPMIPIPLAPGQSAMRSGMPDNQIVYPGVYNDQNNLLTRFQNILAKSAQAEAARDIDGDEVDNAIKIGGLWVVGTPLESPPGVIDIPTPPKKIKKIIVVYNFGGRNMQLANLDIHGPNGRPGANASGGCDVTGDNGDNAFRLNVIAPSITISRFDLHLGSGGDGGDAETDKDCDPGIAQGGNGGEAGNFKITGTNRFRITDYFGIFPGMGGFGGQATAYGRDGKDGKPAEDGGAATATGGQGADNKKGAKVTGSVGGLDNVTIAQIVAGYGGDAIATGGKGGNGVGCKVPGAKGGKATAQGGAGGEATSRTAESVGGDGGDVEVNGGKGGDGGDCDPSDDGGAGGVGGEAKATPGLGGTGKTTRGEDGTINSETGGDGGQGGDGCDPGKGGAGGDGVPPGAKGKDGKNLCILVQDPPLTDPPPEDDQTDPDPGGVVALNTIPTELVKMHLIGDSPCPDPFTLSISGGDGNSWTVEGTSQWLTVPSSGSFGPVSISFNCNITNFTSHDESTTLYFNSGGESLALPVTVSVSAN